MKVKIQVEFEVEGLEDDDELSENQAKDAASLAAAIPAASSKRRRALLAEARITWGAAGVSLPRSWDGVGDMVGSPRSPEKARAQGRGRGE